MRNFLITIGAVVTSFLIVVAAGRMLGVEGYHGNAKIEPVRTITVDGYGTKTVVPDRATITIGVRSFAKEASAALDANNVKMTTILEGLEGEGVAREDIQTSDFELDRRTDRTKAGPGNEDGFIGYQVENSIKVRTDQVARVGDLLDKVISWGATDVDNLEFYVEDTSPFKAEARSKAIADAAATATQLAEAAGLSLGQVVSIGEAYERSFRQVRGDDLASDTLNNVPIFMSLETVTASVDVVFELEG